MICPSWAAQALLDPDDSRVLLQPGGAQNFCQIQDPKYYELSVAGHNALTTEEKMEYYFQLQGTHLEMTLHLYLALYRGHHSRLQC